MKSAKARRSASYKLACILLLATCTSVQYVRAAEFETKESTKNLQPIELKLEKNSNSSNSSANSEESVDEYPKLHLEDKRKNGILDNARQVNAMPIPLLDNDSELEHKEITDRDCEKAQISALWEATLDRSPDIQFVVQKLMPTSDRGRTTNLLMRMISSAIATGASGSSVFFGGTPAAVAGSQITSSAIYNLMGMKDAQANRHAQVDQGQTIMLYGMVRGIADKVTNTYRDYKFFVRKIDKDQQIAQKIQDFVQDAQEGQSVSEQIAMAHQIERAKSDIDDSVYLAKHYRESLIDLAGESAICKLDQALQDQFISEKEVNAKRLENLSKTGAKEPDITREALTKLLDRFR